MTKLMEFDFQVRTYRETLVAAFPDRFPLKLVVNKEKPNARKLLKSRQKETLQHWKNNG